MTNNEGILIADEDNTIRKSMADFFAEQGYQVETTDSSTSVLRNILEKKTPVLVLGSDFDKKIAPTNLIHLLKKCNRHLTIIFVSDENQEKGLREEGMFYPAVKPNIEEIQQAVECAFNAFKKILRTQ